MSKPRYGWWGYAKYIIRQYPQRKADYDELHRQSMTPNLSGMPGSSDISRKTETTAVKELPRVEQKEYNSVRLAIETTKHFKNGFERLEIINLVYWKKSHTLEGAALKVGYSYDRAKQLNNEFIRLVASYYGLLDESILHKSQRYGFKL